MTADLQNQLTSVQDVDIATVYTQLQTDQNVYQASLEATANAFKYSLADYISG
jgi:flagellin-like hook-associated protein FlgL